MRIYVEAYGCTQNLGEAEELKRNALAHGHQVATDPRDADVGVLVSCAVIGSTEDRMVERWQELSRQLPDMVVTGCMVPLRGSRFKAPGGSGRTHPLPIRAQSGLPELLKEIEEARSGLASPHDPRGPTLPVLPMVSTSPSPVHRELVLAQGCTSHCSYCFSRLARGPLNSVPMDRLLEQARAALSTGCVELRLSSLDSSCWGVDQGEGTPRLPDLVRAVASLPSPHEFRLRVGMMSPQSLRTLVEDHLKALRDAGRAFRFLHLPVQSGSDRVLEGMRRGYTARTFREIVRRAREVLPEVMLSTDVIVGFPTEEREDHEATLRMLEEVTPEIVNVTRFSPRPLTPAARLRPLTSREVKRRSREITELRLRLARGRMERWIGWEGPVLLTEPGTGATSIGRLPNYLPVVLEGRLPMGGIYPVKVEGARSTYLLGRSVGTATGPPPAPY